MNKSERKGRTRLVRGPALSRQIAAKLGLFGASAYGQAGPVLKT